MDAGLAEEYAATVAKVTAELDNKGISIVDEERLDEEQRHFVKCYFRRSKISGFISPLWLSKLQELSSESDSSHPPRR